MNNFYSNDRITTALLLAAGKGNRLLPCTKNIPKCLVPVNGKPILERLLDNLKRYGFKKLIIITGYKNNLIVDFQGLARIEMKVEFVYNPIFGSTNNIYSLWLSRKIVNEPFVLFECDLVFAPSLLEEMIYPDRIAIASFQPWFNGTAVSIGPHGNIDQFHIETNSIGENRYKTVNIYSFSLPVWQTVCKYLDRHVSLGNLNCYYETVLAEMTKDMCLRLEPILFDGSPWCEIDTEEDLLRAEKLFA